MRQHLLISLLLAVAGLLGTTMVASAHGENAQEGFLRMETVAFSNVVFSKDTIKQGEDVTITGKATLLDTWPKTLGEPSTGFVNVTAPGPVLLMKDRLVNGMSAPDAIFVKKGNTYDFKLTLTGREPGRWHVHPTFAVEGPGTLIGPGQWFTFQDTGSFETVRWLAPPILGTVQYSIQTMPRPKPSHWKMDIWPTPYVSRLTVWPLSSVRLLLKLPVS